MKNKDYFGIELDTDKLQEEDNIYDKAERGFIVSDELLSFHTAIKHFIETKLKEKDGTN